MELEYPCFYTYMGQNFSAETMKWSLTPGVNLSIPKWGTTYAVDTLDPDAIIKKIAVPYYHDMIEALKKVGYVDGVNVAGGGFHWYQPPNAEWVQRMMALIKDLYEKNGNTPVILVAHSMGAPYSYYLIRSVGDDWMKKYVHKIFYVAPAFMGSVNALNFMFDGFDYKIPIAGKVLAPLSRHVASVWMLLPFADAFKGEIVAYTPHKNYTFDMIPDLLKEIGVPDVDAKLKTTQGILLTFNNYDRPPPVPTEFILGRGLPTIHALKFKKDIQKCDPDGNWDIDGRENGDGDGTVPAESLKYCFEKWRDMGAETSVHYIEKGPHVGLIYDQRVIEMVVNAAC